MNTIFRDEKAYDKELKDFFKSQIMTRISRGKYGDDLLYTKTLMQEFKKTYWSAIAIDIFASILWLISGVFLPFYLLIALDGSRLARLLFAIIWVGCFTYLGSSLREPRSLMRAKIQAYKELLRKVSQYWFTPR